VPDFVELLESIRGVALDTVTRQEAEGGAKTYREIRDALVESAHVQFLPTVITRHRTAPELRAAAQMVGGYAERRDWVNTSINEALTRFEDSRLATVPPPGPPVYVAMRAKKASAPTPAPTGPEPVRFPPTLHPDLISRCQALFESSHYDQAVTTAFLRVEVRVRDLAGLSPEEVGVSLMSAALSPRRATDGSPALPPILLSPIVAEQLSFQALFRGAIGSFRNPLVHREVGYSDPARVIELLGLASLLLNLLDDATTDAAGHPEPGPA
jgi:uncharacterized protein (TIGR02391 family)